MFFFFLARTIRSVSCHNFLDNQRYDSVKRSLTDQQVNSGIMNEISTNNLFENILFLNKILTSSTISLNSIEKDNDQFNTEQFNDCFNDTFLFQTIVDEHQFIEKLIQRYSSLASLDYDDIISSSSKTSSMM